MPSLVEILQNSWLVLFKRVKVTRNTEELSRSGDLKRHDTYATWGLVGNAVKSKESEL